MLCDRRWNDAKMIKKALKIFHAVEDKKMRIQESFRTQALFMYTSIHIIPNNSRVIRKQFPLFREHFRLFGGWTYDYSQSTSRGSFVSQFWTKGAKMTSILYQNPLSLQCLQNLQCDPRRMLCLHPSKVSTDSIIYKILRMIFPLNISQCVVWLRPYKNNITQIKYYKTLTYTCTHWTHCTVYTVHTIEVFELNTHNLFCVFNVQYSISIKLWLFKRR